MRKCFQFISGSHMKFWTVEVAGTSYLATFGRIGTSGQTQIKTFSRHSEAVEKAYAMIAEKERKGYQEVASVMHPGAKATLLASLGAATTPATVTTPPASVTRPARTRRPAPVATVEESEPATTMPSRRIIIEKEGD